MRYRAYLLLPLIIALLLDLLQAQLLLLQLLLA